MFKNLKSYILPLIITLSALSVSASAAFYSVSGLSKLFAGASLEVMIMAGSLEVSKLVIATLLHRYWKTISNLLKVYLSSALVILVLITSMGIYGFLSAAYQETANKSGNIDAQIALIEVKLDNVRDQLTVYNAEKGTINGAVADLQSGLANNVIQYKDRETGEIITTTSSSTRRALERQLDQAIERQTEINIKVDALNEQLFEYETEMVEIQTDPELAGELGPLKYISGLTGVPMDEIINILLLVIIFVFDPLAISLVIAANFAFDQIKPKTKTNLYGEQVPISEEPKSVVTSVTNDPLVVTDDRDLTSLEEEVESKYDDFEDEIDIWDSTLQDGLQDLDNYMEFDEDDELPNEALIEAGERYRQQQLEKEQELKKELELKKSSILKSAVKDIIKSTRRSAPRNYAETKIEETLKQIQKLEEDNTKTY